MEKIRESWLDILDKEILKTQLRRMGFGKNNKVLDFRVDFINNNGKREVVSLTIYLKNDKYNFSLRKQYNEFIETTANIDDILNDDLVIGLIRELNTGRTINGQTYDEARFDYIKNYISKYFKNERKNLNSREKSLNEKLDLQKEVELGEE